MSSLTCPSWSSLLLLVLGVDTSGDAEGDDALLFLSLEFDDETLEVEAVIFADEADAFGILKNGSTGYRDCTTSNEKLVGAR